MSAFETGNLRAVQTAGDALLQPQTYPVEAIWPQESRLFARYALPADARIIEVGCDTGETTLRLAAIFPGAASIIAVDVVPERLALARRRNWSAMPEITFEQGDGLTLRFPEQSFDLVVCRQVARVAELVRVLRPGGWLHLLAADEESLRSFGLVHTSVQKLLLETQTVSVSAGRKPC